MAKMLPAFVDESTTSNAERSVFALLRDDAGTREWTVLHSLGLSRRGRKPYGEIDFVALVPGIGVLCLEVKGGRVACHEGQWRTTNRFNQTDDLNRSPFLQAREGMFALRDAVTKRAPAAFPNTLLFACAVIFPDISFPCISPEWESWQVIDRDTLATRGICAALLRVIREQRLLHPAASADEPSASTVRALKQLLRPDFDIVIARSAQIEQDEVRLVRLTEEQYFTLDILAENDRCLVEGAAGTGKTLLALEYARRAAIMGRRTLLICFNRLLGEWLKRQHETFACADRLTVGSYHKLLREIILQSALSSEFQDQELHAPASELYASIYRDCGQLAIEERDEPYDLLVLDEAQDLIEPGVLEVLNAWVKDGLGAGRWAFFGDFHRQAIFGTLSGEEQKLLLRHAAPQLAKIPLTLNCRNTRNIGEETALLSGFASPPYRMGQIAGLPVDYRYYDSPGDQCAVLGAVLRRLLADGIKPHDIVVLSPYRLSNAGIAQVEGGTDFCLREIGHSQAADRRGRATIHFSTVHAFKGMESQVAVLCDVERLTQPEAQSLVYVAMSRARAQLTVLLHERLKSAVADRVRTRMQAGWRKMS